MRLALLVALAITSACGPKRAPPRPLTASRSATPLSIDTADAAERGLLLSRPERPSLASPGTGRVPLHLGGKRDGFLYVPKGVSPSQAAPLVVFFHGAGGNAGQADMVLPFAERNHVLVLSIDSRGSTWDVIEDEVGPDVAFLDRALAWTFERFTVDPSRIAISGFSDGASYALTLGLANGELFEHVIAFSPGFMAPLESHGTPRVFISHGTNDRVLAIDRCSRPIVERLRRRGLDVTYREFEGPHGAPPEIVRDAFRWLLA